MTAYRLTIDLNCPDAWSAETVRRLQKLAEKLETATREQLEKYLDNHPLGAGVTARVVSATYPTRKDTET